VSNLFVGRRCKVVCFALMVNWILTLAQEKTKSGKDKREGICLQFQKKKVTTKELVIYSLSTLLAVTAGAAGLDGGLLDLDGGDTGQLLEVQGLEQVLGLGIDLNSRGIESRELGDVVVLALALLLLKLEGDTTDGSALDTLHQMGGETSDLVAETLGGDDGNLGSNLLVGLEVQSQTRVVLLDEDLGGPLDSLGTNATLFFVGEKNIQKSVQLIGLHVD